MEEIRSKVVTNGVYNLEAATKEVDFNIDLAQKKGNMMAVSKMLELKAKLYNLMNITIEVKIVDIKGAMDKANARVLAQPALEATYKKIEEASDEENGDY